MTTKVGISARHVHLNKEDCNILFGNNYELTKLNDLTQPGEYSCNEVVTIQNSNKFIEKVRVLGPLREYTQVEISKTDSYFLNINPPIRNSGELEDATEITITGPIGAVKKNCCIIATRHIHMNYQDALKYNYKNNQLLKVSIPGEKGGIINNVSVKVSDKYILELHLDFDDANSHLLNNGDEVSFEKCDEYE